MDYGKRKRITLAILCAFALCFFALFSSTIVFSAKAEVLKTKDFFMTDGAQVRVDFDSDEYQNAIRFTTKLNKTALPSEGTVKVVTMIVKSSRLTDNSIATDADFTRNNLDALGIPYKSVVFSGADLTAFESGDCYVYNACLVNLVDSTISSDLSARSYLEVDGVITYYTAFDAEKNKTNMWDVAKNKADEFESDPLYAEEVEKLKDLSATFDVTINGYNTVETFSFKRGSTFVDAYDTLSATFSVANESAYYGPKNVKVDGTAIATVFADRIEDGIFGKSNGENRTNFHETTVLTLDFCNLENVTCDTETLGLIIEDGVVIGVENKTSDAFDKMFKSTTIIVPSSHGGNTVTAIGANAFNRTVGITHVVLPESVTSIGKDAFSEMAGLQTIVMPGVTEIKDENVNGQFLASVNLRKIVVGPNFDVTAMCLNLDGKTHGASSYKNQIKIYSTRIGGHIWVTEWDMRNDAWDRDVCYCWEYQQGTYEPVALDTHKYIGDDGTCDHCGHIFQVDSHPQYAWDETTNSYYISGDGMTFPTNDDGHWASTDIVIPSWYNDGIHGDARVTRVAANALQGNKIVTSIKLPSTVTSLGRLCFAYMDRLKTVSMTGALYLTSETSNEGMFFQGSTNLQNLIIGPNIYAEAGVHVVRRSDTSVSFTLNVFVTDDSGTEIGTARGDGLQNVYLPWDYNQDKNESYGGTIFYYYRATEEAYNNTEEDKKNRAWRYDDDGFTPIRWADYLAK